MVSKYPLFFLKFLAQFYLWPIYSLFCWVIITQLKRLTIQNTYYGSYVIIHRKCLVIDYKANCGLEFGY